MGLKRWSYKDQFRKNGLIRIIDGKTLIKFIHSSAFKTLVDDNGHYIVR